ncbi:cysteine proteinase [Pleomassaria siparia CBS 279.74]|uniref:Cysteine proteinase n=1 Tax=Pleomassaria siparia CBS 279.74 TaxID=1314801 RepID=A0A6G1K905_9PLEO|nr:cysteine proteinase [Pleomassaria siparia CBS 279.74]
MTKRNFDDIDFVHDGSGDAMDIDEQDQLSLSPVSRLRIPGAYPQTSTSDAQLDVASTPIYSLFASVMRRAPAIDYLARLCHNFTRKLYRQQAVRAEPISRGDGSRKKIFLDAGLTDFTQPTVAATEELYEAAPIFLATSHNSVPWPTSPSTPISTRNSSLSAVTTIEIVNPTVADTEGLYQASPILLELPAPATPINNRVRQLRSGGFQDAAFKQEVLRVYHEQIEPLTPAQFSASLRSSTSSVSSFEYENDLSELPDAESTPLVPRKTVTLAKQQNVKEFYKEDPVYKLLDSYIEDIMSSPGSYYNESIYDSPSTPDSPLRPVFQTSPLSIRAPKFVDDLPPSSPLPRGTTESVGFSGVPADTWDLSDEENSLEESLMSQELVNEFCTKAVVASEESQAKKKNTIQQLVSPLTDEESRELEALAAKYKYLSPETTVAGSRVTVQDLKTLLPDLFEGSQLAWLNDNIVNEYLTILTNHEKAASGFKHKRGGPAPPVHNFASQWWTSIQDDRLKMTPVKNWALRKQLGGKQLLDANIVLFPICQQNHWRLVAIKPKDREIHYMDSLKSSQHFIVNKVFEWMESELGPSLNQAEWTITQQQQSTQQLNAKDCGVFACLNALVLLRGEAPQRVVASEGMEEARRRIAWTLIKGHTTTEM